VVVGVAREEISSMGSMAVLNSYGPALQLVANGTVQVDPLIAHGLALGDGPEALEMLRRGDGLKIQLLSSGKEDRA
jgi:threonine dehydrogenase-like Zn-dependent dehydrogenase